MNETKPLSAEEGKEPSKSGLGALLRSEREKKGLTLDQVASITKMRAKIVEALENERWADLPPPVFVRGFIRSYAGILGLDGKELLHVYEKAVPAHTVAGKPAIGKPVEVRRRSYKWLVVLVIILALILGVVTYLQVEHPVPSGERPVQKTETTPKVGEERRDAALTTDQPQAGGEKGSPFATLPPLEAERAPAVAESARVQATAPATAVGTPVTAAGTPVTAAGTPVTASETQADMASPDAYVLDAIVLEETWVRIRIDNGETKEYIFRPGARPQWKAKEGFQLMVGNAGGIELELNGTKLKSLGKPGRVVKRNIPESFQPTGSED